MDVRERLAVGRAQLPEVLKEMARHTSQGVILSTCNRTEFYTLPEDRLRGYQSVGRFVEAYYGTSFSDLESHLYTYAHGDAALHLFRVASGLDSMIVGESQILGQVREAFSAAVKAATVANPLSHLFHQALRVGKRVRRETGIGQNALSISHACLELARRALGDLAGRSALVIGAGDAGKLAARALRASGVGPLLVTNRTFERAQDLAQELGAHALPFDELEDALMKADIVVSSTEAPSYVLPLDLVRRSLGRRARGPLFLLDIAVPRDVDPRVEELSGVLLYDVDDLDAVAETNRQERAQEVQKVEAMVHEEVAFFLQWWEYRKVVPTLTALQRQAEALRLQEVQRAFRKLPDLTLQEQAVLEALSKALVRKLLHHPVSTVRAQGKPEHLQALQELFQLDRDGGQG